MKQRIAIITAVIIGLSVVAGVAHANPSYFAPGVSTAAATSTLSFMTAGTATSTTPTYDSYSDGSNQKADGATLLEQLTGSTTATTMKASIEESADNIDWYVESATTTTALGTKQGGVSGLSSTTLWSIPFTPRLRYARVVFTIPAGSVNGAVWGAIVPSKEIPE